MAKLDAELDARLPSKERATLLKRIADLTAIGEQMQATIDALRTGRIKLPIGRKPSGKRSGGFIRVICGDNHGAHIDHEAANAFLADLKELKPAEFVHLGDGLDCGGWLAQHHVLGFVPETNYSYQDDCAGANEFLDEVDKRTPGATKVYLLGNHEGRIEKQIIKMTMGNTRDCEMMQRLFGARSVLSLDARKWQCVGRDEAQPGVRVRGAIKLGKCYFTHGTNTGPNATAKTLAQFKANVCHGHTHRISMATGQSATEQTIGGWSFGCLCKMAPLYYDTRVTDWSHGYGVQVVHPDGQFITLQIPIIEGQSLLRSLLNRK